MTARLAAAILLSFTSTCKRHEIDPQRYLTQLYRPQSSLHPTIRLPAGHIREQHAVDVSLTIQTFWGPLRCPVDASTAQSAFERPGAGLSDYNAGRMTVRQQIERGFSHHRAGRLAEAEKFYRQVLTQQPNHAEALHLLGMLAGQCGQLDAAEDLLRQAIRIKPDYAEAHATLGTALKRKGASTRPSIPFARPFGSSQVFPGAYQSRQRLEGQRES